MSTLHVNLMMKLLYWVGLFGPPVWFSMILVGIFTLHGWEEWRWFILASLPFTAIALSVNLRCANDPSLYNLNPNQAWKYLKKHGFR